MDARWGSGTDAELEQRRGMVEAPPCGWKAAIIRERLMPGGHREGGRMRARSDMERWASEEKEQEEEEEEEEL
jgi:hypothetical protein